MMGMTGAELDEWVLERATKAYREFNKWLRRKRRLKDDCPPYEGEHADDVLRAAGVTWDGNRVLYRAYTDEMCKRYSPPGAQPARPNYRPIGASMTKKRWKGSTR